MAINRHNRHRRHDRHQREDHRNDTVEERWPESSDKLAEIDDEAFVRAIVEGRQRELTTN